MKLTYHSWKDYQECPKKYYLKHIKKAPPTEPINKYFALYGKTVEKFFELFSNSWKKQTPYMPPEYIRKKLMPIYDSLLGTEIIDWGAPFAKLSREDIFEQAYRDICTIMDSPNQNLFLNTQSEVSIKVKTKDGDVISSRIDFIHENPTSKGSITIIDGKGTNKIGKNISKDQVILYCLMYYFHTGVMPIAAQFFYYRMNQIVPVEINLDIINEMRARISLAFKTIKEDKNFEPTASYKSCRYCDYRTPCLARIKREASSKRKKSKIQLPDVVGVQEFSF